MRSEPGGTLGENLWVVPGAGGGPSGKSADGKQTQQADVERVEQLRGTG